jgi:hypothetical protein
MQSVENSFMQNSKKEYIATKEEWKALCKKLQIRSLDEYYQKVIEYPELPEKPSEVYPGFISIMAELCIFSLKRR